MSKDFVLEFQGDFFHIKHEGSNKLTSKNMRAWEKLAEACKEKNCRRVLSEGEIFPDDTSFSEAYVLASFLAGNIPHVKIACFIDSYVASELTDFFELVAANRALTVKFFSKRNEAIQWLGFEEK